MKRRLLIVDDDDSVRKVLLRVLEKEGHECAVAKDALTARELLTKQPFDLMLCDIIMPGESGLDLIRFCAEAYPDMGVIVATGIADPECAREVSTIGPYGYIIKPFGNDQIIITVGNALRRFELERAQKQQSERLEAMVLERTAELQQTIQRLEEAKNRIQESETKFRTVIEQANDGIAIVQDRTFRYANQNLVRMFGYEHPEEIVDCPMEKILHPKEWDRIVNFHESRMRGEKAPDRFIFKGIEKSGGNPMVEVSVARVNYEGKDASLAFFRDITDRITLELQLAQARKLEAIGQLAAGIAHEINTPTQYINDNILFFRDAFNDIKPVLEHYRVLPEKLAKEGVTDNMLAAIEENISGRDIDYLLAEIPQALEQTLEGVERVSTIVRSMKEFSHPGVKEKTAVDINRAIENTVIVSRNEWKYVADLETDLDPLLPHVPCLPAELNQVILNIITNAAHAIGDVVGDGNKGKGLIRISTRVKDDSVEIEISDTGAGIPEGVQPLVFDPFFTTKEVGKGTGQGLAISRSVIVDKHGGSLDFETKEGKGTSFFIRLPLEKSENGVA